MTDDAQQGQGGVPPGPEQGAPNQKPALPPQVMENFKADNTSLAAYEGRFYDLAVGSVDRAKTGATTVQGASTAIAALYTGVLGLVFSATGTAFPIRGLITPLFLGVAVVLSTYYLAFITPGYKVMMTPPGGKSLGQNVHDRIVAIGEAVDRTVRRRSWAIRAAVVALAVGLVGMALPFITTATFEQTKQASATPSIDWPTPPAVAPGERGAVDFGKILYQAQIDEFRAHLNDKAAPTTGYIESVDFFILALIIGLLAVIVLPVVLWFIDWATHAREKKA
ncbi:hypothetical protein [Leifsonia sp. NPDC058248]|uniref:hypothetical protein n=1 Tax=Leifsonia sp. NPDC058248 TaxID=3346402 RepID=UPI0036DB1C8D